MSFLIQHLSFSYGSVRALKDVSFEFDTASRIALVGANGAGKSTLMALVSGALQINHGTIRFNGRNQGEFPHIRTLVSHLPQDAYFPSGVSIRKSLTHFSRLRGKSPKEARIQAERLIEEVGLSDAKDRNDRELSHGMRKRAALAQALIPEAQLLILDEPTAGLDPVHAHQIRDIIRNLEKATTVLISSHNLGELEDLCDQVVILDQGSLKFSGSMREATQARFHLRLRVSHMTADVLAVLTRQGLEFESDGNELTIRQTSPDHGSEANVRAALIAILQAGINIESLNHGTSLEASLIETLKKS